MSTDDLIFAVANFYLRLAGRKLAREHCSRLRHWPNVACPERYSERMLWRKLVDRNPNFVLFSDKLAAKDILRRLCPELPVPQTLWVGTAIANAPEELLQRDVFLKANHGSSFNYRTHGRSVDRAALTKMTQAWLATPYGREWGEWPYLQVPRKLFLEEVIGATNGELLEFNIRASNGMALLGSVMGRVKTPEQWYFYLDPEGHATWGMGDSPDAEVKPLPPQLKIEEPYRRAVEFAERLSRGVDYARYDFFWTGQTLYGGEITLFPAGGMDDPRHPKVDQIFRDGWDLLESQFLKEPQRGLKQIYANALRRRLQQKKSDCPSPAPRF